MLSSFGGGSREISLAASGMSKRKKLLEKAKKSPQNLTFEDLETLASSYGLPLERGGSHYVQRLPDGSKNTIKREPGNVKRWYVRDVVEAIEDFGDEDSLDKDADE